MGHQQWYTQFELRIAQVVRTTSKAPRTAMPGANLEAQTEEARRIMEERRVALRQLAESLAGSAMRLAAVTDIHGNLPALEAVLADVGRSQVGPVVNLGDILAGPLLPVETADRLMALALLTIRGNHERQVLASARSAPARPTGRRPCG